MKLDEFISDILITGSKDYFRRREEISEKISLLLSPTKGPGQKTSSYFGSLYSKNDRTLGISTL
jgi:hypothetical protein